MKGKGLGISLRVLFSLALMAGMVFGAVGQASAATIIYVKQGAAGLNNGTSWANAYKSLQTALSHAGSGSQIWVARGTYKPALATNLADLRTKTFKLKNGVAIYGGFAGSETALSQRNPGLNVTILSGNIGSTGIATDNAYHVVTGSNTNSSAVLDGFTIRAGRADGPADGSFGGGMYVSSGSPTLTNLTFKANTAISGGGLWIYNGSPTLTKDTFDGNHATLYGGGLYAAGIVGKFVQVVFTGNLADADGGGMYNVTGSYLTLTHVTYSSNTAANNGGGLYSDSSTATLNYVAFRGNTATHDGGGMYGTDLSTHTLTNATFSGNTAGNNGGGLYLHESGPVLSRTTFRFNVASVDGGGIFNDSLTASPTLRNVTFGSNSALANSGGMYNTGNNPVLNNTTFAYNTGAMANNNSDALIYNSILYSNGSTEIANTSSNVTIVDSIVKGANTGAVDCLADGSSCTNVLTANPMLGPLQKNNGSTETMALGAGSSAIDAGGVHWVCAGADQRGVSRPQGAGCDIGAYEVRAKSFVSEADYDGWVLEDGQASEVGGDVDYTSPWFQVGDNAANEQERGFLSFDTASLPNTATVVIATLKVKSGGGLWDTNPFTTHGTLWIDLANPNFGDYPDLSSGDFEANATVNKGGSIGSTISSDGFYTGILNSTSRANINRLGRTQLRLEFGLSTDNDDEDDFLFLASGDTSTTANRPTLMLYYNP